jgi:signal transduction histidine kinase
VDLLKKENLQNEKAAEYLDILSAKSWRLKTLIEDLVEASKASSGTIPMNLECLNLVELVRQSIGEFEDRFLDHNLETILTIAEEPIYIIADGRSTYRIIENIFSNVNKYALSGTRVYVDITADEETVTVSVKNISSDKLNITSDELMERFVRGDISRNTEGSGLGLSIAKSLAGLQNAVFDIYLDGDLFKAVVSFQRLKELPQNNSSNEESDNPEHDIMSI